jgi:hypothetical protein
MSTDEKQPDTDQDFEERPRKAEEFMRGKWPELRDSQIAALVDHLRELRESYRDDEA